MSAIVKYDNTTDLGKGWKTLKTLLKETYFTRDSKPGTRRDHKLLSVLYVRAIVIHSIVSAFRVYEMIFSAGPWYSERMICSDVITEKCVTEYNENICDPMEPFLRFLLRAMVVVGVILDLVSLKWRPLAKNFIYHEIFMRLLASMVANYAS